MIKKTLVHLSCLGLLFSLAACGETPEDAADPVTSETGVTQSTPREMSEEAASSAPASSSPASERMESEEPLESEEPASTTEIPATFQGSWLQILDGETVDQCTEEESDRIVEITATTVLFFASLNTLDSVEKSDSNSFVGTFRYQDDGDYEGTARLMMETVGDQTMELTDPDQSDTVEPALYGRCPA